MSKEDEMMKNLDELLKTKIGRAEGETEESNIIRQFKYTDTDILSIRDKNNWKFAEYINKLIDSLYKGEK